MSVPKSNVETILHLRQEAADNDIEMPFACPACGAEMRFRRGRRRGDGFDTDHFYHLVAACTSTVRSHDESEEHFRAKERILTGLPLIYPDYQEASGVLEHIFTKINRKADVVFFFPDGEIDVHEAQFSPITLDELQERTRDYHSIGARVIWYLGPKVKQHDWWCTENLGVVGYLTVNYEKQDINLPSDKAA